MRLLLALLWTIALVVACLVPGNDLPQTAVWEADKLVHVGLFAVLGWLWLRALPARGSGYWAVVLGAGVVLAGVTELLQGLLPIGRSAEPMDAAADVLGLLLATTAYLLFERGSRKRRFERGRDRR